MDADTIVRLRLAAGYLKRTSNAAAEEVMQEAFHAVRASSKTCAGELDWRGEGSAFPPPGRDPRPAHLSTEENPHQFSAELARLLTDDRKGNADSTALRRIAELTELLEGEQPAQVWWQRAALQGDAVAIMMLVDD
ncbi:hypothetical protein ABII15_39005 (plasmid) [Streptomyces sp. HUAS MG91]|uniref:RNA polymerase sigma-70 region 2 domain-containing protein n=1 Tax=Streptomyces tabacisoli TaxID=3156398 RepID=A0AAU8J5C6_9ACTN